MIKSREDIIELLKDYMDAQRELERQAWISDSEVWSRMMSLYSNGIVICKFREQDVATMQVLKKGVNDKPLFDEIFLNINFRVEECQKLQHTDIMAPKRLELYKKEKEDF